MYFVHKAEFNLGGERRGLQDYDAAEGFLKCCCRSARLEGSDALPHDILTAPSLRHILSSGIGAIQEKQTGLPIDLR